MSLLKISDFKEGLYCDLQNSTHSNSHKFGSRSGSGQENYGADKKLCHISLDDIDWSAHSSSTWDYINAAGESSSTFAFIDSVETADIPLLDDVSDDVLGDVCIHAHIVCVKIDDVMVGSIFVSDLLHEIVGDSMGGQVSSTILLNQLIIGRRAERMKILKHTRK